MASPPARSGDEISDGAANQAPCHQNMVVGWILLDRTTSESDGTVKYYFLRPEQTENFKDRDTEGRKAYYDASVDLTNKGELDECLVQPFIKLVLLQQHQWLLVHQQS
uniref:Uncharacterized protein n=2 Tax=Rhizochromulina marina TaxID=1034831 RepID=A0A7S2SRT9_9STRA|mmetsp:Transcript_5670/g.16671  ORF Transcript_5670/g.16671 Transcript_5670/m.16671 type:complete len:108 (+) Transcript_5670:61-384(+)